MSLVDYASSEEEEEDRNLGEIGEVAADHQKEIAPLPCSAPPPLPSLPPSTRLNQSSFETGLVRLLFVSSLLETPHSRSSVAVDRAANMASPLPPPSLEGLPDVSILFSKSTSQSNQMIGNDHSSRVAAAVAENASRKRVSDGSAFSQPSSKNPKGKLAHLKNAPNTLDGLLLPPQLKGRSNVVTEDIGKLFVGKRTESSQ